MKSLVVLVLCFLSSNGDIYMHNPRGSNNRLDEQGRERNNANRLFDSQNNNRGGYNVGSVYYYAGSKVPIEWTNQHSCGNANNHCEMIIQYMCGDNVRDGATTTTIPDNPMQCQNYDCTTDTEYGMHEDYDYYLNCKLRERNMGLFLADQNLGRNKNKAKNTRQNPNGNRRGYECPEERDYYPYWHPTPWKDIAIMTNDATRCPYYEEESENVKGRWACVVPRSVLMHNTHNLLIPNNEEDCKAFRYPENDVNGTRAEWKEFPSHGIAKPECREGEYSRDNHLGNGIGGYPNLFNWTVPDDINHERCVIRMRYNISTEDYDGWNTNSSFNSVSKNTRRRWGRSLLGYPNFETYSTGAQIEFAERYGFETEDEATERGYELKNNPEIQLFPGLDNVKFRLAINTAQFGRTFEDRSHTIAIRKKPSNLDCATIHNVNVRGKRGNIVQVYPAVEYDFVPNTLQMNQDDCVHFQWTGSNTNPHNNDGQGRAGTDRSNIVLQMQQAYAEGSGKAYEAGTKYGHWGRSYPEDVQETEFLGLAQQDLMSLALLTPYQFRGEMSELDDAGTYFDLGPRKVTGTGTFHYLCTRNNNFSNRSQKGRIICDTVKAVATAIGWNGGNVTVNEGQVGVFVEQGSFERLVRMNVEQWSAEEGEARLKEQDREVNLGDGYASPFVVIHPEERLAAEGKTFQVEMDVETGGLNDITIYKSTSSNFGSWEVVNAEISDGRARFAATEGGAYVAAKHSQTGKVVGAVVGSLLLVGVIVGGTFLYCRRNPGTAMRIKRSFQSKV